jgi:hypothetical protein
MIIRLIKRKELSLGKMDHNHTHRVGDMSPIKYVFYIIRRIDDQVLGDMKEGNM